MMKSLSIIQNATNFGTFNHRKHFFSFLLKSLFFIIPAFILGHYTDTIIQTFRKKKQLGDYILNYIILQTFVIILTMYILILLSNRYTNEFQLTIIGSFFIVLYYGMQTNYIQMIKEFMSSG